MAGHRCVACNKGTKDGVSVFRTRLPDGSISKWFCNEHADQVAPTIEKRDRETLRRLADGSLR